MTNPLEFKTRLAESIQLLYGDAPIIGDPDLLDFDDERRAGHGAHA
jgi:type III restriction enzyme